MKLKWLVENNYQWKLYVGYILFVLSFFLYVLGFYNLDRSSEVFTVFTLGATLVMFIFFFWILFSIRCRICGGFVVLILMKTRKPSSWLVDLYALEKCPKCHDKSSRPQER